MTAITIAGAVGSLLALGLFLYLLFDCVRRRRLPKLAYGGEELGSRGMRWLWGLILTASFVGGIYGYPVVEQVQLRAAEEAVHRSASSPSTAREVLFRFPALVVESDTEASGAGVVVRRRDSRTVQVPWAFLLGAALYWWLVVRWSSRAHPQREATT